MKKKSEDFHPVGQEEIPLFHRLAGLLVGISLTGDQE